MYQSKFMNDESVNLSTPDIMKKEIEKLHPLDKSDCNSFNIHPIVIPKLNCKELEKQLVELEKSLQESIQIQQLIRGKLVQSIDYELHYQSILKENIATCRSFLHSCKRRHFIKIILFVTLASKIILFVT